ncbi:MAG: Inorganic triphosphatase [Beijerinckiaceae bacterium]|nr:MAG: Inorganic triphosphatase [Beijerinckiaceae bacterium]
MAAGAEIELKFLFAERNSANIEALVSAVCAARQPAHQRLRAIYFDTLNLDLWKQGFTLRVRASGESHIQTVKRMTSSGIQRDEWEAETSQAQPDLDLIKNTPLARLTAKPSIGHALRPAFEMNIERSSYLLEAGGGVIEASFDRGVIEANGEKLGVRELELELKSGGRRALYNIARAFVSQAPLHPSLISKAERGHLLAKGALGRAAKSSKPRLGKDVTCGQAFQEICQTCLHDFHLNILVNILGLEKLDNAETVHQARVAIRRLRAVMALFKPLVFDIAYRKLRGELKWLARLLGAARDMDVLQANLPPRTTWAQADARDPTGYCEAGRLRARQAAVEALNSERGRILLLELAVWIEDGRWQSQPSSIVGEPIQSFAGLRLKKRHEKLVRQGAGVAHLAPRPRHKVRIKAKELRYMAEFFVDVPGAAKDRKRLKKLIDCCEKLQSALGAIRDAEAMAEFLESTVGINAAADCLAKTAILSSGQPRRAEDVAEKDLKKAVHAYSRLAAIEAF